MGAVEVTETCQIKTVRGTSILLLVILITARMIIVYVLLMQLSKPIVWSYQTLRNVGLVRGGDHRASDSAEDHKHRSSA